MFHKQSETRGNQTALIDEMIGNQKVVKAFGYEEKASERFAQINADLQKYSQKAVFYSSLTNPSTRFVNNVIYAGVALVGAFMIPGGALTVGGLSVLLSYANQYMKPSMIHSLVITEMQSAGLCEPYFCSSGGRRRIPRRGRKNQRSERKCVHQPCRLQL